VKLFFIIVDTVDWLAGAGGTGVRAARVGGADGDASAGRVVSSYLQLDRDDQLTDRRACSCCS